MRDEERVPMRRVTYSVEYEGRIVIVENVPARVDPETGEQFFARETVEQLQAIVWSDHLPGSSSDTWRASLMVE